MCQYQFENIGSNGHREYCLYPEFYIQNSTRLQQDLLIDSEGLCIFHSKNSSWKIKNNFKERFYSLLHTITILNETKSPSDRDYVFVGFNFPKYEQIEFDKIQLDGLLDLTNSVFNCHVKFLNMTIKSMKIEYSKFRKNLSFNNVIIENHIFSSNSTFQKGLSFVDCKMPKSLFFNDCFFGYDEESLFDLLLKNCQTVYDIDFQRSTIKLPVSILNSSFDYRLNFDHCLIEDQFLFEKCRVSGTVSFNNTEFTLIGNTNPMMSSTHFEKINLSQEGKIIFRGKEPQHSMTDDLSISFEGEPEGLLSFENFNLNRLFKDFKSKLFDLQKQGIVEIGKGCRKYHCQSEIFTISASKATQALVLEIVRVFTSYFEIQENCNLGIEVVERTKTQIRYFFFTDELISHDVFLQKINDTETNLWETFSNLSKYSIYSEKEVEKKNLLIDIAGLFLKIGNYSQNKIAGSHDLQKVLNSIAARAVYHLDERGEVITKIHPSESIVQTENLIKKSEHKIEQFSRSQGSTFIKMKVKQVFKGPIEKVINADNFYDSGQNISSKEKKLIEKALEQIQKEQSSKKRQEKWERFIKKWSGTISAAATPILKDLLIPE